MFTLQHLLKMEPTQCSETLVFNTQAPGKYPEDNLSLLLHGESLKSRIIHFWLILIIFLTFCTWNTKSGESNKNGKTQLVHSKLLMCR